MKYGIPIAIEINVKFEREAKEIIQSMIVNFDEWEKGKEPLKYKLGEHITSQLELHISRPYKKISKSS